MSDLESEEEEEIKDKLVSMESSINELKSEMKEIKELIKNK
jgi:hypothetical protein